MSRVSAVLLVALSLGLAWAIRGHFGHEWGACWAGAIGTLAVLTVAGRSDWTRRLPVLAALGGIGWATGGMMSYGILVGYGRGTELADVAYGLAMLGIVGGLYGAIGGGLLGLGLESTPDRRPDWAALVSQMVAGGILAWGLLIYQLEWFMTPPRSELWAACLGAAVALAWFLGRHGYWRALRVAAYAALGAGLGFAGGNFAQTLGTASGLAFNWWNVMEFTLGCCGGAGLAYGVFSRSWPTTVAPSRTANRLAVLLLLGVVPAVNVQQAFDRSAMMKLAEQVGVADTAAFADRQVLAALLLAGACLAIGLVGWEHLSRRELRRARIPAAVCLLGYLLLYLLFSHLRKGVFYQPAGRQLEQYLYWGCLAAVLVLCGLQGYREPAQALFREPRETAGRWTMILIGVLILLAALSLLSVHAHAELPGAQRRWADSSLKYPDRSGSTAGVAGGGCWSARSGSPVADGGSGRTACR